MLIKFTVENYLSFRERQTLDLVPGPLKELEDNLLTAYHYSPDEQLLKTVAIYGHNSHGKSNFIKAFDFFRNFILNSFSLGQTQNKIEVAPFRLNTSMVGRPCFFELYFIIKATKYRYRVQLTSESIIEETLYYAEPKIRENYLFERIGQEVKISKTWNKEAGNRLDINIPFARPHILFLSVLISQDKIPRINDIANWINSHMIIPDDYQKTFKNAQAIYSDLSYRSLILKFIEKADLGFTTIFDKIENTSRANNLHLNKGILKMWYDSEIKNFDLYTTHSVYDENKKHVDNIEFEMQKHESAGSIKYFIIVCLLSYAIKNSQIVWIDELDARFHSDILTTLVKSFHDSKINAINAQMIFTTHNTILMDRNLRRDQMVAITKNDFGESKLERLHTSKKPIKTGKSVEKEYRKGNLSGVSKKIRRENLGPSLFDGLD